jgi:hypothetical protein
MLRECFYRFLNIFAINLVPFPVVFLAVCVAVEGLIASSTSFQIWTTFSTCRACLEDRRWNAFGLVSKYVISLTFFTAVFGNNSQIMPASTIFPQRQHSENFGILLRG